MAKIIIVGLGPGPADLLTPEAHQVLVDTDDLYVRTINHPVVPNLPRRIRLTAFDELFERAAPGGSTNQAIADRILRLAERPEGVVYAVPGSPMDGDGTVRAILDRAEIREIPVRLVAGVSLLDAVSLSLRLDPFGRSLQLADATSLVDQPRRDEGDGFDPYRADGRILDPTRPSLVVCHGGVRDAPTVIRALSAIYPVEHTVSVVRFGAESPSPEVWSGPIERLGEGLERSIAVVYLPPLDRLQDVSGFDTLRYIVARLRAPNGCPWDREQTHQSMKKHFIEETYEAIAALDEDDWGKFSEELGDVLLQVVMHSQLSHEERRFDLEDVLRAVNEKLIRRHPPRVRRRASRIECRRSPELGKDQADRKRRDEKLVREHPTVDSRADARRRGSEPRRAPRLGAASPPSRRREAGTRIARRSASIARSGALRDGRVRKAHRPGSGRSSEAGDESICRAIRGSHRVSPSLRSGL